MSEVFFIIALVFGLWSWGWLLTGKARVYWLTTMGIIGVTVFIMEVIGTLEDGRTISQMYWNWSAQHPETHWIAMGIFLFGCLSLIWHLSEKVLFKKSYRKEGKIKK